MWCKAYNICLCRKGLTFTLKSFGFADSAGNKNGPPVYDKKSRGDPLQFHPELSINHFTAAQGPNEKGPHGNQTCMIDVSVGHWPRSFVGCNVPLRETHMSTVFQNGTVLRPFHKTSS